DRPYFPLSSKILQKYIHDYTKIEKILIDNGVIERNDEKYIIGQKSYSFRFTEKYYGQKYKEHEIQTVGLYNKIQAYYKSDPLPSTPENKPYQFLKAFWTNGKLKMDVEGAMKWINATYQTEISRLDCYYAGLVKTKKLS